MGTKRESQALAKAAKPLKGAKKSTLLKALKASKETKMITKAIKPITEGSVSTQASDILTLPEFACTKWLTHFLPTLYDCLGCSSDPFTPSADMITLVQAIVDVAYPDSSYRVVTNDRLITMVCKLPLVCTSADGDMYRPKVAYMRKELSLVKKPSKS